VVKVVYCFSLRGKILVNNLSSEKNMNVRSLWITLIAFMVTLSPIALTLNQAVYAEDAPAAEATPEGSPAEDNVMNEEQLANMLINVLGLAALLPPNPQQADVFGILLQNEIVPKNGWDATNLVTEATVARILVQSLGDADKVEKPDEDKSWVEYLKSIGIEFGSIEDAVDQANTLTDPVALQAVEVSTDPLRKVPSIRPADEQQLGADLQSFRRLLSAEDVANIFAQPEPPVPPRPEPATPN